MESPDMIYVDLCDGDSSLVDIPDEIMKDGVDLCDDDYDIDLFFDAKSEECKILEEGEFVPDFVHKNSQNNICDVFVHKNKDSVPICKSVQKKICTQKQVQNKPIFCKKKRNAIFLQKNAERKRKAFLAFQEKQRNSILDRQVVEFSRALYAVFPGIGCNLDNFAVAIRNFMIGENFGPDFIARSALHLHQISGALIQLPDIVRYLR